MRLFVLFIVCFLCVQFVHSQVWVSESDISVFLSKNENGVIKLSNIDNDGNGGYILLDSMNNVIERGIFKESEVYFKYEYYSDTVIYSNRDSVLCAFGEFSIVLNTDSVDLKRIPPNTFVNSQNDSIIHIYGYITKDNFNGSDSASILSSIKQKFSLSEYSIISSEIEFYSCTRTVFVLPKLTGISNIPPVYDKSMGFSDGYGESISDFSVYFSLPYKNEIKLVQIEFVNRKLKFLYRCDRNLNTEDINEVCSCFHFNEHGEIVQKYVFKNGILKSYYLIEKNKNIKANGLFSKTKFLPLYNGNHKPKFYEIKNGKKEILQNRPRDISWYLIMFY